MGDLYSLEIAEIFDKETVPEHPFRAGLTGQVEQVRRQRERDWN